MTEITEVKKNKCNAARKSRPSANLRIWWAWGLNVVLVALSWALATGAGMEGWKLMWILASATWVGFKVLALVHAAPGGLPGGIGGWLAYWFWPGMDASVFGRRLPSKELPVLQFLPPLLRLMVGIWIVWWLAMEMRNDLAAGWCGMAGLVLILHFGCFDLLAFFWRRWGYPVTPLMRSPWRAHSLADFWGARWNTAFSHVANRSLFRPLTRRFGLAAGTMAGFALSGIAHELVISVPAGAGYGLPTLYFLTQGVGTLLERRLSLRGTVPGKVLMFVVLLGPAGALFHPPFMTEVIVPFLNVLHGVD